MPRGSFADNCNISTENHRCGTYSVTQYNYHVARYVTMLIEMLIKILINY